MTSACFSRGHTGFSRNATLVATVNPPALAGGVFNSLNSHGSPFSLNEVVLGYFPWIYFPVVGTEEPDRPTAKPCHQSCKSALVTIATFPVNELTGIATISFPEP